MIDTLLSVAGLSIGSYSAAGGVAVGKKVDRVASDLEKLNVGIEKISDHILYANTVTHVKDTNSTTQRSISKDNYLRELLIPLQERLGEDFLASSHIAIPALLKTSLENDPWSVMYDVRPLSRAQASSDPDAVPLLFQDEGAFYVGWQKKGVLPSLFGCEFDKNGFYLPPDVHDQQQEAESINAAEEARPPKETPTEQLQASNLSEHFSATWVPVNRNLERESFLMKYTKRADYEI